MLTWARRGGALSGPVKERRHDRIGPGPERGNCTSTCDGKGGKNGRGTMQWQNSAAAQHAQTQCPLRIEQMFYKNACQ